MRKNPITTMIRKTGLLRKSFSPIFCFFLLIAAGCGGDDPTGTGLADNPSKPLYNTMFREILDNLLDNYWVGNGDWTEDAQGDDVAFGPWLLYSLGRDQGIETFSNMATQTVDYEVRQLEDFFDGAFWDWRDIPGTFMTVMKTVLGGPALIDGYKYTSNPAYREWLDTGLDLVNDIAIQFPELFVPFVFDPVVVLGVAADMDLDTYEVIPEKKYLDAARKALQVADNRFWHEEEGYYGKELWDWPEASMLMALSAAYRFTSEPHYQERAETLLATVQNNLWDHESETGGYFGHDRVVMGSKALSGNNIFTRAFLDLYENTEDPVYLQQAMATLDFLESVLYADRMLWHHWTPGEGRADTFCTGCNLMTLGNIYRLNKLRGTPISYNLK